jgi:hypothetical protein
MTYTSFTNAHDHCDDPFEATDEYSLPTPTPVIHRSSEREPDTTRVNLGKDGFCSGVN